MPAIRKLPAVFQISEIYNCLWPVVG